MYTARRSVQAVVVALLVSGVVSLPVFSQSARFLSVEERPLHLLRLSSPANPCSDNSKRASSLPHEDTSRIDSSLSPCDRPISSTSGQMPVTVVPCSSSTQAGISCSASIDAVRDDLNAMGKHGQTILRARDRVLQILQSENACTAWYRTKEPDPAAVFRTLTFALDRNPYVARVMQAEGPNSTVTINVNGAFYFPMATVVEERFEGGPGSFGGALPIRVGPYAGGTFRAQVVTL